MSSASPPEVIPLIGQVAQTKANSHLFKIFIKGFYAGAYLSFGGLMSIIVAGGVYKDNLFPQGLVRVLAGFVFPVGLLLIVLSGMELFTSNVMYMLNGFYYRKVDIKDLLTSWLVTYFSNFLGSLFFAYFMVYKCSLLDHYHIEYLLAITDRKLALDVLAVIFRGIGCNWLVCLAIYHSFVSKDVVSKIVAMHFPIWIFVTVGFEHSVANMFYFPVAMMYGSSISIGDFIVHNLLPVTFGNLIGGGLFIGTIYYYLFHHHQTEESLCSEKRDSTLPTQVEPIK